MKPLPPATTIRMSAIVTEFAPKKKKPRPSETGLEERGRRSLRVGWSGPVCSHHQTEQAGESFAPFHPMRERATTRLGSVASRSRCKPAKAIIAALSVQ